MLVIGGKSEGFDVNTIYIYDVEFEIFRLVEDKSLTKPKSGTAAVMVDATNVDCTSA